jgi:folate-binding protein YgfZ
MPKELVPPTLKRLRMFVLMSKVTLEDASESLRHIGVAGVDAESQLKQKIDQLPTEIDGVTSSNNLTIIRVPGAEPRFEIFGTSDEITNLQQTLGQTITPAESSEWELQAINGMSFKKGCYPGQEIIARMQYLGKLKRRMYLVSTKTDQCPKPADSVVINENGEERKVGSVVSAQLNNDGCVNALIVMEIAIENNLNLYFSDQSDATLEILALPYILAA